MPEEVKPPPPPSPTCRMRLHLSYDGGRFYGWQKQKDPQQISVQGEVERALEKILGRQPIRVIASGRTDRGVHALQQVVHFDVSPLQLQKFHTNSHKGQGQGQNQGQRAKPRARASQGKGKGKAKGKGKGKAQAQDQGQSPSPYQSQGPFCSALNTVLPGDIVCQGAWQAPSHFHALHSAQKKCYKYLLYNAPFPSALHRHHSYWYWYKEKLDLKRLHQMSSCLKGTHDFKSFQNRGTEVESTVRHIFHVEWKRVSRNHFCFTLCGNGFLKQMVRNLVGTLLHLYRQQVPPKALLDILACRERQAAGPSAPPQGLYLSEVFYPPEIERACIRF